MKSLTLLLAGACMFMFSACATCPFAGSSKKKSECCAADGTCKKPSKDCCSSHSGQCASGHTHTKKKSSN